MKKIILLALLATAVFANNPKAQQTNEYIIDEKCEKDYNTFMKLAQNENCYDLKYSLLSFKSFLLRKCAGLDENDVKVAYYVNNRVAQCKRDGK